MPNIGKKRGKSGKIGEKIRKNREKRGKSRRKGKNGEVSFTLPLLTDRAGYATAHIGPLLILFVIVLDYALRMAIEGKEEDLGFQLSKRRSRRVGPDIVTDFDFADDLALLSEELYQAKELLQRVETSVAKVGLKMNAGKTKFRPMSFNQSRMSSLQTNDGTKLEEVKDFKYLGALMESTAKDTKQRKAAAWKACSKSGLSNLNPPRAAHLSVRS